MPNSDLLFLVLRLSLAATVLAVAVAVILRYNSGLRRAARRTLRTALRSEIIAWLAADPDDGAPLPSRCVSSARTRWHRAVLFDALSSLSSSVDPSDRVRLAQLVSALRLPPRLRRKLRSSDRFVRAAAVEMAGLVEAHELLDSVADLMRDESGEVRMAAAAAYSRLRGVAAVPALCRMVRNETGPVAQRAAELVAAYGTDAADVVLDEVADPTPLLVRLLGACVGPIAAQPALVAALQAFNPAVRLQAARSLGAVGSTWTVAALINALDDGDTYVRSASAAALGRIGDPSSVAALIPLLGDADHVVRARAATALADLGATEALIGFVTANRDPVSTAASAALQSHLVRGGLADLVSSDPLRRVAAEQAVRALLDNGYDKLGLESQHRHPNMDIRRALADIRRNQPGADQVHDGELTVLEGIYRISATQPTGSPS